MAALVLEPGTQFDPSQFWSLATSRLPRYAVPLYLRLTPTADMTGNYKLRKVDLQREGYDPHVVTDPLYVRDDKRQTYLPLEIEHQRAVG
jgi:fatty-acyl-CoA synthase